MVSTIETSRGTARLRQKRSAVNNLEQEFLPPLTVAVTPLDDAMLVAAVRGEVDLATALRLQAILIDAIDAYAPRQLVIDAADMSFLDAAGMAALISVYQYAEVHRVHIRMERVRRSVWTPLRIVNLVDFFRVTAPDS
jgi:anti-anti-sigma factor